MINFFLMFLNQKGKKKNSIRQSRNCFTMFESRATTQDSHHSDLSLMSSQWNRTKVLTYMLYILYWRDPFQSPKVNYLLV